MRDLVISWGVPPDRVTLLPNPAPRASDVGVFEVGERPVLAFAGRLTAQKDLGRALDAMRELTDARLLIAGDGPERARLEAAAGERVEFLGPLPRAEALGLLRAADASILTSAWENFPHGVVESLAVVFYAITQTHHLPRLHCSNACLRLSIPDARFILISSISQLAIH